MRLASLKNRHATMSVSGEGVVERGVEAPVCVPHALHEERVLADAAAEADALGVEPALDVVNLKGNLVAHPMEHAGDDLVPAFEPAEELSSVAAVDSLCPGDALA